MIKATSPQWLTVRDASELLGVTGARVRQFLSAGRLRGHKFGSAWAIDRVECERFAAQARPVGNPNLKKKKTGGNPA